MEWGNSVPEVNLVRKIFMNYPNQQIQPIFNIVWLVFFHQQFRGSKKSECDNGMLEYQSSLYIIYHFLLPI